MSTTTPTMDARRARILNGDVGPVLFSLSWPMSIGLFSVIAFNVVDTLYIGQLGAAPLAAMGYCFPVIFSLSAVAIGVSTGAVSLVSRALGAGRDEEARELAAITVIIVALSALVLTAVMLIYGDAIFAVLKTPPELMDEVHQYMDVWLLGLPVLVMPIVMHGIIRAAGEAKVPSALMVIAAIINAVVSPFLVFGLAGAPEMGMAGAAVATVGARSFIALLSFTYLLRHRLIAIHPGLMSRFGPSLMEVLQYAGPAFGGRLVAPLSWAIVTRILSGYGPDAVAGYAVGARIEALMLVPFYALQTGIGPFIGQNVGADQSGRLRAAEGTALKFCFLWGGVGALLLITFGGDLAMLFTDDVIIGGFSDRFMGLMGLGLWGAGLMIISIGMMSPLGYPSVAMAFSGLRYLLLFAGLAGLASFLFSGEALVWAVFLASPISYALTGVIAFMISHRLLGRPRSVATARTGGLPTAPQARAIPRRYQHPSSDEASPE